jgi:hypothetical protein
MGRVLFRRKTLSLLGSSNCFSSILGFSDLVWLLSVYWQIED